MITKHIPFWKMDVAKTEQKLAKFAEKGLLLNGFRGNRFTFEKGEPAKLKYRIYFEKKCGGEVPKRILEKGWEKIAGSKHYYIVCTSADSQEAGPSTKNWVSYYRKLQIIYFFVISFISGMLISEISSVIDTPSEERPMAAVILFLIVIAMFLALLLRIHHSNKKLSADNPNSVKFDFTIPKENLVYTKEEEKAMLKSGEMMKKTKPFWICAPDKTAAMIEKYAMEGWRFYRFSKLADELFFVKAEPCHMKFVVDFLHEITNEYITLTREDGWKLEFTSIVRMDAYCIWSKTYADGEDEPEIYSDRESAENANKIYLKKMILPALICTIIMIAVPVSLGIMFALWERTPNIVDICFAVLCLIFVVQYGIFSVLSLGYYKRMKNKIN